jgi:hypothetical protein
MYSPIHTPSIVTHAAWKYYLYELERLWGYACNAVQLARARRTHTQWTLETSSLSLSAGRLRHTSGRQPQGRKALCVERNLRSDDFGSLLNHVRSRDSSVGIATAYGLDDREVGVRVPVGSWIFSSPRRPDRLWGTTQPPIQLVPWVKRPGREADHLPAASAEVNKMWVYTSIPPYVFMT